MSDLMEPFNPNTRTPKCGHAGCAPEHCRFRADVDHHDDDDRARVYQERDLTTAGREMRPGR